MVELWLVVEQQVNNTLYWAKEFFYSASFSVKELNEIGEYNNNQWCSVVYRVLGPVYTGPDKFGTGPLQDLIGSAPKRSHESGPKLFQIARPFTRDRIVHQIAKITAEFVERHLVVKDESLRKSQNIEE